MFVSVKNRKEIVFLVCERFHDYNLKSVHYGREKYSCLKKAT